MEFESCLPSAIQLMLEFDDLPEDVTEAIRSQARLLAQLSPEEVTQPD